MYEEEPSGGRRASLPDVAGWQERVQRHTVEQIVETFVPVPMLDLDVLVPQTVDQLADVFKFFDTLLPAVEQDIEVPKILRQDKGRTLVRSSGPSVPASSSPKEAANKAKRALWRTLCVGCIQTPLGKSSCSSSMLASRMPEAWFWCGTKLDLGVLAVLMGQTAADFVGSDMGCDWLLLVASR